MEEIDCINNFENYYEYILDDDTKTDFTKEECKYIWLSQEIIGFTTYDYNMSLKWGKLLYKTIKAIIERRQSELIETMYEEYIICLNLIKQKEELDWGASIRYCWFDNSGIEEKYREIIKIV